MRPEPRVFDGGKRIQLLRARRRFGVRQWSLEPLEEMNFLLRASRSVWMKKVKTMKVKSWIKEALLLRDEIRRFFLSSALYCWNSNGKPLCKAIGLGFLDPNVISRV
ncbi:hypothetical protein ACFX11_030549 [Malus domestica]